VREVVHERDRGLVFEVAFEGLQRSSRHRSGIAMRFPRISRLRFDKLPRDADRLERLEALLARRSEPFVSRGETEGDRAQSPPIRADNA
jgi:DNA ligase-1